ncbi:2-keto-3-deoxy-L-rhamnonate aldolase [Rhodosalinus halophilus]|uniref:Hydroxypyruvate/pyruvate aldolase n=1 Tax=Rhodosalinus halophilus TaxID=2259333 RepID=A0A365U9Z3_9RHOB|nr:HpcH/HpaI aldolase/citrate lyase family protein [Rhodosalinus halophilus]RBI85676.1 2-keto-3-deoxy-L-rhamnonate aldolase [Rhodosalinus halophilus]
MPAPHNAFKAALARGETVFGCWLGFAHPYPAEIAGHAGFDWLLIDGEHAPNDLPTIAAQLQVLEPLPPHAVVRLPMGEDWAIKQVLDAGAQTLLIPLVESAEQARALVRATRYPPEGIRGMGASFARASRFSGIPDYVTTANAEICLLLQVETRAGLAALDDILAVEGVDGVFIGPADLSADMGYPGRADAPEVQAAIGDALERIRAAGRAPGILSSDDAAIARYLDHGAQFVAVGIDVTMLAAALRSRAARWTSG